MITNILRRAYFNSPGYCHAYYSIHLNVNTATILKDNLYSNSKLDHFTVLNMIYSLDQK